LLRIAFLGNFAVDHSSETHHAKTLEHLGHTVSRLQESRPDSQQIVSAALESDLFIWVHTHGWHTSGMGELLAELRARRIPSMTYHLDLWLGLHRQGDMKTDDVWGIDHFFTVDRLMADYLNANTPVFGHYLQAGVYEPECSMFYGIRDNDVIFVGSKGYHPEWPYRPQLINWLAATYGPRFQHHGGDGLGTVRGHALNQLYANTKVVVGDTLCLEFDYPDYWSDRAYETLGRGGFLIHPYVAGMERHFADGEHLVFYEYGDFDELKFLIDYYLEHDEEREKIRRAGHEHVKANHTYTQRWASILDTLALA
jgi:hypothetical protein